MKRFLRRARFYFIVFVLIIAAVLIYVDFNLKPVLLSLAESKAKALGAEAINSAVYDLLRENSSLEYSDLITIHYDNDGRVAMLQADTMHMNELSVRSALLAQKKIDGFAISGVKIPLGAVTGSRLIAGWGPSITVRIIPAGSAVSEFVSEFSTAGINQTRHRIFIKVTASVRMVIPTASVVTEVFAYVQIAESIIVGTVPGTYADVTPDNILDLSPD
ncbi:MAG: sporulation protein YunB [Oscillospiraceae bacterium]|jgi:sporulation protein YunB|nr:sporulation protein YunB [Oscillospiraceae bacterium]